MKRVLIFIGALVILLLLIFLRYRRGPVNQHPWFEQFNSYPLVIEALANGNTL